MLKRSISQHCSSIVRLTAMSFVLAGLLVSCGRETTEPGTPPDSSAPVEKDAVSVAETAPSASAEAAMNAEQASSEAENVQIGVEMASSASAATKANAETRECIVYSPEDRSDGICYVYTERVYCDGNPEPETERVVFFRAPANAVNVVIPDGVTDIESGAFRDCANLESVVFPNSVRSIPANALSFSENTKVKSVVLPAHSSVGSRAFFFFPSLEGVTLNKDGKTAAPPRDGIQIGDEAFAWCRKLKRFECPEGIRSIGKMAFIGCSMESVTLPDGVETIGEQAFCQCEALKTLHLPASLKTIGAGAFSNCSALKEIAIPESVTEIADDAFRGSHCEESVRKQMESRRAVQAEGN